MKHYIWALIISLVGVGHLSASSKEYLLLDSARSEAIKQAVAQGGFWTSYHDILMDGADEVLDMVPVQRKMIGRRLLETSREVLRRALLTGYAYRITADTTYAHRCEQELLTAAAFDDWNPSHFLDVAEMTAALAIGYDWCDECFDPSSRKIIENAILTKGILPSYNGEYNSWLKRKNNWNQVCNGGITLGALALRHIDGAQADSIAHRAVESVRLPMRQYGPDGAYPEGYSYWGYGTTFNVLLIDALEQVYGSDFGLCKAPGFLESAAFIKNMIMGDGASMNYGDCNNSGRLYPPMFWLASRANHLEWLAAEPYHFGNTSKDKIKKYRYSVFGIIWGASINMDSIPDDDARIWYSKNAPVPVAVMRTDQSYGKGISLAVKGGAANGGHAHMDAGEFLLTRGKLRWSIDLGPQDYTSLENQGLDLWNKTQNSDRWRCFRYNNLAHSTLAFDESLQVADGCAALLDVSSISGNMYAVMDLTPVYQPIVSKTIRRTAIVNNSRVEITDTIVGGDSPHLMRWTMVTPAEPELSPDGKSIILRQRGEVMTLTAQTDNGIEPELKIWTAESENSYDQPNPGVWRVGYEIPVSAGKQMIVTTYLQ